VALTDGNLQQGDWVVLGRVSGVYGVSGWVRLHSYTNPRLAILDHRDCLFCTPGGVRKTRISEGRAHGKGVIARFDGISDRDAAAALIDTDIAVGRAALPELTEGHYYWADLEGLTVVHKDGSRLGEIAYLLETGANDVLVVQGDREILIPYLWGSVVLDVDIEGGTVQVDWEWD